MDLLDALNEKCEKIRIKQRTKNIRNKNYKIDKNLHNRINEKKRRY